MKKQWLCVMLMICATMLTLNAVAVDVMNEDFEHGDYVIGSPLSATAHGIDWVVTTNGNGTITIEASGITGGDSKALELNDTVLAGGSPIEVVTTSSLSSYNGGAGITNGTIEFDYRYLGSSTFDYHQIIFYDESVTASENLVQFVCDVDGVLKFVSGDGSGGKIKNTLFTLIANTDYHITLDFNTASGTFDGEAVQDPSGSPATVTFNGLVNRGTDFDALKGMRCKTGAEQANFQVDNLKVVDTAYVMNEDFEHADYVLGNPLSAAAHGIDWNVTTNGNGTVTIETSGITGGDSKALELNDTVLAGGSPIEVVTTSSLSSYNGGAGIANGTIEFDYRYLGSSTFDYHQIIFYDESVTASENLVQFVCDVDGVLKFVSGDGAGVKVKNTLFTLVANTDYHITLDFSAVAGTFDGEAVQDPSGSPATVTFDGLLNRGTDFDALQGMRCRTGAEQANFQVDNIIITDEGSASSVQNWALY